MKIRRSHLAVLTALFASACSGGGGGGTASPNTATPTNAPTGNPTSAPSGAPSSAPTMEPTATTAPTATPHASATPAPTATPRASATPTANAATAAPLPNGLTLQSGFTGTVIAHVGGARELAALPNGDLLVGTSGSQIYIVPNAESANAAGTPAVFATLTESPAEGVAYGPNGTIYAATNTTIWKIPYASGAQTGSATAIALVRQGSVAPNSDGDVHRSTSVAASTTALYAGVGSSCNACAETDPTRATVQKMNLDGSGMTTLATRSRNPIAMAINPATQNLWIGGAGQDNLATGHPYEYFDSPTKDGGGAEVDYGWPVCEENHHAYASGANCTNTVQPAIEFTSYATLIGAAFYPANPAGAYAFPAAYRGGVFVTSHGSWHSNPSTPPRVYFVAMRGDTPATAVNWSDPTAQGGAGFLAGYGTSSSTNYSGRPTGVAVGSQGSLFVADDQTGNIIRVRPQ